MIRHPRWIMNVTHIPTGISQRVTADHHRTQRAGLNAARKVIAAKLAAITKGVTVVETEITYDIEPGNEYPHDLEEYREKII